MAGTKVLSWQSITCPAEGAAVTFTFHQHSPAGSTIPKLDCEGFVIRYQGRLMVFRNSCPHAGSPLDWLPGQFFSEDGSQLVCHTHDARFDPATGNCLSGPCPHGLGTLPFQQDKQDSINVPAELASGNQ